MTDSESLAPEVLVAIAAVVVALCALGATVWQGYLSRRHNRLSVRPKLRVVLGLEENVEIYIENVGLGPAVVAEFSLELRGLAGVDVVRGPAVGPAMEVPGLRWNLLVPGDSLAAGQRVALIQLPRVSTEHERGRFLVAASNLYVSTVYRSFYGEAARLDCACRELAG